MAHSTMLSIHRVSLSLIPPECREVADLTGKASSSKTWAGGRENIDFLKRCHESELQLPLGFCRTPRKGEKK